MPALLMALREYATGQFSFRNVADRLNAQEYRTRRRDTLIPRHQWDDGKELMSIEPPAYEPLFASIVTNKEYGYCGDGLSSVSTIT